VGSRGAEEKEVLTADARGDRYNTEMQVANFQMESATTRVEFDIRESVCLFPCIRRLEGEVGR
jgi:hypothetical protein